MIRAAEVARMIHVREVIRCYRAATFGVIIAESIREELKRSKSVLYGQLREDFDAKETDQNLFWVPSDWPLSAEAVTLLNQFSVKLGRVPVPEQVVLKQAARM
jgi:hypothetical protein